MNRANYLFLLSSAALIGISIALTNHKDSAAQNPSQLNPSSVAALPDGYHLIDGIGAYKVHTQASKWNDARHTCKEEDSQLAVFNSIAEAKAIVELFKTSGPITGASTTKSAFLGYHDLYKEGEFVTIFGESMEEAGYNQWDKGEPNNNRGAENCGGFIIANGNLNDINCQKAYAFVCELSISI